MLNIKEIIKTDILNDADLEQKNIVVSNLEKYSTFTVLHATILLCAVLVACFGLVQNSILLIAGSKLLSPLLTPVIASGYSVATKKFDLLKKSLLTILYSLLVGILISTLFFIFNRNFEVNELFHPGLNFFSILIALIAGVLATITTLRKNKFNILPGVALIVSFVPPLAQIGFAISILDFNLLFLYLLTFVVYIFFVALGSLLVFQLSDYKSTSIHTTSHNVNTSLFLKLPCNKYLRALIFLLVIVFILSLIFTLAMPFLNL